MTPDNPIHDNDRRERRLAAFADLHHTIRKGNTRHDADDVPRWDELGDD